MKSLSTVLGEIRAMSKADQIKVLQRGLSEALMELNDPKRSNVIDEAMMLAAKLKSEHLSLIHI